MRRSIEECRPLDGYSCLALVLRKKLDERCRTAGFRPVGDVLRDLDRLQDLEISKDGQQMVLRTPATGVVGPLFKAARDKKGADLRCEPAPGQNAATQHPAR